MFLMLYLSGSKPWASARAVNSKRRQAPHLVASNHTMDYGFMLFIIVLGVVSSLDLVTSGHANEKALICVLRSSQRCSRRLCWSA